jgi:hypothetical protein
MILDERFADNRRGWPDEPGGAASLFEGGYRLRAGEPGRFVVVRAPVPEVLRDISVSATFRKVGGPPGGGCGLVVRAGGPAPPAGGDQAGRFYVLEAGDRGEVGIWRRDGDRWIDLVPWTPSEAVRPGGEPNELTARAVGRRLRLLVNGAMAAEVEDAALAEGAVGIFVGGDFNEVVLERFVVEVP